MPRLSRILPAAALFCASLAAPALADVFVNGQRNAQQVDLLAKVSCGPIPDGADWLDADTGLWGYWGNAHPVGHIRARCGDVSRPPLSPVPLQQRRKSLSERGMLFRPGEIINGD